MPDIKQTLREQYNRLKKAFEKIIKPGKEERQLQLLPLPARNKKF
jgi:hypothetical protein